MATVDEIKARIQEETGAFADEVAALLDQFADAVRGEATAPDAAPAAETEAAPEASGVNADQQNIVEVPADPTPVDPTPEETSGESSTSSSSEATGSSTATVPAPPDTTGL